MAVRLDGHFNPECYCVSISGTANELARLAELRDTGVISEPELQQAKSKALSIELGNRDSSAEPRACADLSGRA
jgi:hypothetical protein